MFGFKQINTALALDKYQTTKYLSERTGFNVVVTEFDNPTVRCSILVVTEPDDDEGYVHALEHLIFNGSKKYPYRGILTKIHDSAVSWTDVDQTSLSFSAKDQSYALKALPVFLDHIMFPLLCEEYFLLDVHHIDGEGNDGGLVYEEMKEAYNVPYKRLQVKLFKEMYPDSSYCWDSSGSELELRMSTSNTKVKEFHKKYYRPENITILVSGQINHSDVLRVVAEFEDEVIAKRSSEPALEYVKPWQTIPPPPNYGEYNSYHSINSTDTEVYEHEKDAYMIFAWRGPVLRDAVGLKELAACEMLLDYLSMPKSAPLHKHLVDIDEPLAGNVSSSIESYKISLLSLMLFNVPVEKVEQTKHKTLEYLSGIRSGAISINVDRIQEMLERELSDEMEMESPKQRPDWIKIDISTKYVHSLYLETDEFEAAMNPQWHLKDLLNEPVDYWLDIFRKYFTEDCVLVNSIPTESQNEDLEEKQRIEKQRQMLGKNGLKEKARILDAAKKYREVCVKECANFSL